MQPGTERPHNPRSQLQLPPRSEKAGGGRRSRPAEGREEAGAGHRGRPSPPAPPSRPRPWRGAASRALSGPAGTAAPPHSTAARGPCQMLCSSEKTHQNLTGTLITPLGVSDGGIPGRVRTGRRAGVQVSRALLTGAPSRFAFISVPVGCGAERRGCPGAGAPMGSSCCTAAPRRCQPREKAQGADVGSDHGACLHFRLVFSAKSNGRIMHHISRSKDHFSSKHPHLHFS